MTKADEIAAVDRLIAELGPHSYIGPWLASVRGEIVADLQSDYEPRPMLPGAALQLGARIEKEAREHADGIKKAAYDYATHTRASAQAAVVGIRERARHELEKLAREL